MFVQSLILHLNFFLLANVQMKAKLWLWTETKKITSNDNGCYGCSIVLQIKSDTHTHIIVIIFGKIIDRYLFALRMSSLAPVMSYTMGLRRRVGKQNNSSDIVC